MKNRASIPQRDLELLSAYIDGQLSDRQARKLESRLEREPELKRVLAELRTMVQQLRDFPTPRLSRHFTLTPEMVGQEERSRAFPVLRFATALAGLAFVVLVGLEGLQSISGSQMASRAPAVMQQAEQVQEALPAADEDAIEAPAEAQPEMEALEIPADEPAGDEPEALMMEEPQASEVMPEAEDQVEKVTGTPEPTLQVGLDAEGLAEGRAATTGETQQGGLLEEETSALEPAPLEPSPDYFAAQEESTQPAVLSPLRWLQVISGALFIVLSVLTITFRKRPS